MKRRARGQVRKKGYQLDMINSSVADPAGIAVSIDGSIEFGGI